MIKIWASVDGSLPRLIAEAEVGQSVLVPPVLTWAEAEETTAEMSLYISQALETAIRFGGIDGDHHKAWVIDQMVRLLAGDDYADLVESNQPWDEGIAP